MGLAKKIDHVAIAVNDLEAAVRAFSTHFDFPVARTGELPRLGIRNAHLQIGDATLELFTPTADTNPARTFLKERGEGIYLLSLEVEDLDRAAATLDAKGIRVQQVTADDGTRLGFISPKHTHGVLLQLLQRPAAP